MYTDPSINTCTLKNFMIDVSCPGTLILKHFDKQAKKKNPQKREKFAIQENPNLGAVGVFLCVNLRKSGVGHSPLDDTCLKPP